MLESAILKFVALVGFLVPGGNDLVTMTDPVIELRQDSIAVSCVLEHTLSDDLRNVIDSGTPVVLTFVCRLRDKDGNPGTAPDATISHRVTKDLATGAFKIDVGERSLLTSRLLEHSTFFRLETAQVWPVGSAASTGEYYVEVSAKMEPVLIHATGRTFDLMAFWDYRVPRAQSEPFTRRSLDRRRVAP